MSYDLLSVEQPLSPPEDYADKIMRMDEDELYDLWRDMAPPREQSLDFILDLISS